MDAAPVAFDGGPAAKYDDVSHWSAADGGASELERTIGIRRWRRRGRRRANVYRSAASDICVGCAARVQRRAAPTAQKHEHCVPVGLVQGAENIKLNPVCRIAEFR